jgi:hypothetical protein
MQNKIYRQGDIIIQAIKELPADLKLRKNTIILYGEVTGHKHQLLKGKVLDGKDLIYLSLAKDSAIVHEEHNTINLKAGNYAVLRTREYDYSAKKVREVMD